MQTAFTFIECDWESTAKYVWVFVHFTKAPLVQGDTKSVQKPTSVCCNFIFSHTNIIIKLEYSVSIARAHSDLLQISYVKFFL